MSGMTLYLGRLREDGEGGPQVCRGSSLLRFRTQEGEGLRRGAVPRGVRPREEDVFRRCGCIPATACSWAQRRRLRDAWPHQIRAKCTVANTTSGLSGAFSFLAGGVWRSLAARWRGLAAPWLREGKVTFPRISGLSAEQQHWLHPVAWKQVLCMWAPPPSPLPSWGSVGECASEPQVICLCHACGSKLGLGPTLSPSTADLESNPTELPDCLLPGAQLGLADPGGANVFLPSGPPLGT